MTSIEDYQNDGYAPATSSGSLAYEPSIASSAPSSQGSVFSDDATLSSQSSVASSISGDFRHSQEEARDRACAQAQLQVQQWKTAAAQGQAPPLNFGCPAGLPYTAAGGSQTRSYADVTSVPLDQRQNPRRNSLARASKPPPLVRQCERKVNFVDNLVDSATQMVEVIWPLSVPCGANGGSGRGVLPLRTYIEETLRRSRTSYSTLQVALYYLILIKPFVPKCDFTREQKIDCPGTRSLMCGRRMFLTALILASKYLQDRNYSAKAWSKMSSLKVCEINTNERTFLARIGWKLHLPDAIFKRWTEIVLKYTPSMQPPGTPGQAFALPSQPSWKTIVPLLTPELDKIPLPGDLGFNTKQHCPANYGFGSPSTPTPTKSTLDIMQIDSTSQESTPTPTTMPPRFLEPRTDMAPPTPALARMGPLPTPQLTPTSQASSTPAASACSSRRPSMCSAMSLAHRNGLNRCAIDTFPTSVSDLEKYRMEVRRPSIVSRGSSPESMITDNSRSSRASSISSVSTVSTVNSTSSMAPTNRACLARQATCRSGRMAQQPQSQHQGGLTLPQQLQLPDAQQTQKAAHNNNNNNNNNEDPVHIIEDVDMTSSPPDFSVGEKARSAPDRHSKHAPHHHHHHGSATATPPRGANTPTKHFYTHHNSGSGSSSSVPNKKRSRAQTSKRSALQEEIRLALEEDYDDDDDDDDDDEGEDYDEEDGLSSLEGEECGVVVEPSPAAVGAQRLLWKGEASIRTKEMSGGRKRRCCAEERRSVGRGLFGEVL